MLCVDVDKLLEQDRSVRILAARTLQSSRQIMLMRASVRACVCLYVCLGVCACVRVRACVCVFGRVCVRACVCSCVSACPCPCVRAWVPADKSS